MANEKWLINAHTLKSMFDNNAMHYYNCTEIHRVIDKAPTVNAVEVLHGRVYTAHEVAEILAEAFGDTCACNFNGNDEWLPFKCELIDCCPNTYGVACWEQYLKFREAKMDGDANA